MTREPNYLLPSRDQLVSIIRLQSQIARQRLDLSQVMGLVVEACLVTLQADGAAIELREGDEMVFRATAGIADGRLGLRLRIDSSLSGLCVRTGEAQNCADAETDLRVDQDACRKMGLRSLLMVPLQYESEVVGVLKIKSKKPGAFNSSDEAVLGMLADVLSAEMHFANMYSDDSLYYHATHDHMTGLYNRSMFYDRLRSELIRTEREGIEFGVMILDMDGLKGINDTYGHRAGDAAICEIAKRINHTIRKTDTAARLGGDEFGVILQPTHGLAFLNELVERLRVAVIQPFEFESNPLTLSISIGTSISSKDGLTLEGLIDKADKAMYQNKRERKAPVVLPDEDIASE